MDLVPLEKFQAYLTENRMLPRYDSRLEAKLPHPFWEVDFESLNKILKELGSMVIDCIEEVPKDDLELQHIFRIANTVSNIPRGSPVKVALIGAQGVGKSLLLNALFGRDGLSLTGADGKACTSVMIRYINYEGSSVSEEGDYVAEIEFFDSQRLEKMIEENAQAYYHVQHADEDSDDEGPRRTKSLAQDEMDKNMKDTAEEIFCTLFGGEEYFLQAWNADSYHNGEFTQMCLIKCKTAMKALNLNAKDIATFVGKNPPELLSQIRPFMTKVKDKLSLWPLVKCITIRFHDSILEQNIEVIDLPGFGDTNTLRARYADEIKDTVDCELIVADTIRISSDDAVINKARAAIANHGIAGVKLVATKIDVISNNQLDQCHGPGYDEINEQIRFAESQLHEAVAEDDVLKSDMLEKRKTYLECKLRQLKIQERAENVSKELARKLHGNRPNEDIQIFHVSAGDYMTWIKNEKILFREQPALSPTGTGIPALRQYLMQLPADQNLRDYTSYVFEQIPYFIGKIRRVADPSDRDVGFQNIADEFDQLRNNMIPQLLRYLKEQYQECTKRSIASMRTGDTKYRKEINRMVDEEWLTLRVPTLNKVLRCKGKVQIGTSKAKGLEKGCDWNENLSQVLAPAFKKWYVAQIKGVKAIDSRLVDTFCFFNNRFMENIDKTAAGISTTEKAKKHYRAYRDKFGIKLQLLSGAMNMKQEQLLRRATMEDGRQNSFIATLTDPLFDDIFKALPDLKPNQSGKRPKYVEPKGKFQKKRMKAKFTDEKQHFVDRALKSFEFLVNTTMAELLEEKIGDINTFLGEYSTHLRGLAPVNYQISQEGYEIRAKLQEKIPDMEELPSKLQQCFPNEAQNFKTATQKVSKAGKKDEDISFLFDRPAKRKAAEDMATVIKQEPGTKKPCVQ